MKASSRSEVGKAVLVFDTNALVFLLVDSPRLTDAARQALSSDDDALS